MPGIDFSLYLVTDRTQTGGRPLVPLLCQALGAGLRAIQLRERDLDPPSLMVLAQELQVSLGEVGAHLFINDRIDVALALGATGVHLRVGSLPVTITRGLVGSRRLLGVSAHSVDDVVRAEAEGADFAVLGPVYGTPSKAIYGVPLGLRPLEEAAARTRIPILAIGGITVSGVRDVRRAGAFGVAVISSILASDDVAASTRALLDALRAPL